MKSKTVAAALGLAMLASSPLAAPLPEKTSLADYTALMQAATGAAFDATEQDGSYVGTVRDIGSASFFEAPAEGRNIDELVQFILRSKSRDCTAFRPVGWTREELAGATLVWVSVRCLYSGVELRGEEFVIADPMHFQSYSVGGPATNREAIMDVAGNLFKALVAKQR